MSSKSKFTAGSIFSAIDSLDFALLTCLKGIWPSLWGATTPISASYRRVTRRRGTARLCNSRCPKAGKTPLVQRSGDTPIAVSVHGASPVVRTSRRTRRTDPSWRPCSGHGRANQYKASRGAMEAIRGDGHMPAQSVLDHEVSCSNSKTSITRLTVSVLAPELVRFSSA